ncbi:MAG TPA: sigma 54-interacting transcriptional regulator [Polyangia bacterium]|nr:sigma 54-interacting transcriptional regulator [Polyangia bacterium]
MATPPGWDDAEISPTVRAAARAGAVEPLRLEVVAGPDAGRTLQLGAGVRTIGKSPHCDLVLSDSEVSRRHLELRVEDFGVVVRDLESTNGSFHHGARFNEVMVGAGAVITVGATKLAFVRDAPPASFPPSTADRFGRLYGRSRPMRELYAVLERVAPSRANVLIEAETGSGKELCAEAIHAASGRKGPFVICDLAGIPRSLIESELFGHVKGAFTGASSDRVGAFASAHGGTLFLDEVGELELGLQPRLLRMLEQGAVRQVGGSAYREVDVRVIAATNRELAREVEAGSFRADLYHRLAVVGVRIPPLRERKEDLAFLVEHFLGDSGRVVAPAALALFEEHDWPGNVRELRNVVERGLTLTKPGDVIEPRHVGLAAAPPATHASDASAALRPYHDAKLELIESWERAYVERVLAEAEGNVSAGARRVGLGRAYLYRLIRKYNLAP